ncbi:hypothetical protein BJX64DRAFT_291167 [Aspergillus heterothallicus]
MRSLLFGLLLASAHGLSRPDPRIRDVVVDASTVTGTLKNLQGTNACNTTATEEIPIPLEDLVPETAERWDSYGIKQVMIYVWPDVFTGWNKSGLAGDPTRNENYNWAEADSLVRFVRSHGAIASIHFNPDNGMDDSVSSPDLLGEIGFMIADRYMNNAYDSGFHDALDLFDFYPEQDLFADRTSIYQTSFDYFAAFARGVARANSTAGVGAWGSNRILHPQTNYTLDNPYITQFYHDCHEQNVPIKAATYHFTNAQYSMDPYDIKRLTDALRNDILIPAGWPDIPIWVTEFDQNPAGTLPTSPSALASYNDPAWFAGFTLGTSMYAQDTSLAQALPWTGFGYGGYGAGNAKFPAWFNDSSRVPAIPLNVAAAWKLQADLVVNTSTRVSVRGSSPDGFAVLAGRSESADVVQVLLNNYRVDYDIMREIAAQMAPGLNTSTTAYPLIQSNGLLNGEQACLLSGTKVAVPVCQTFIQASIRNNTSTGYKLRVVNLPWSKHSAYKVEVFRVGGTGAVSQLLYSQTGKGTSYETTLPFPANAQDLVRITRK